MIQSAPPFNATPRAPHRLIVSLAGWWLCCWLLWGACVPTPPTEPATEPPRQDSAAERTPGDSARDRDPDRQAEPGRDEAAPEPEPDEVVPESRREASPEPPPGDQPAQPYACPSVSPKAPPAALGLDPFYEKYVDAGGIPLIGSARVPDAAFSQAYYLIANMLRDKPCIRQALVESGTRVGIIATSEKTTQMPEYSDLNKVFPNVDWDQRARGLGATPVRPLTTGAVENLLQQTSDRWFGENILLHEFAHTIFNFGITAQPDGLQHQTTLTTLYNDAINAGRWKNTYAGTNQIEYWAEAVQSWFNNNKQASPPDGIHNHVNTRSELKAYDPKLEAFVAQFFAPTPWSAYCSQSGGRPWTDPTPQRSPPTPCTLRKAYLTAQRCDDIDALRSPPSSETQQLHWINRTFQQTYSLASIDEQGKRQAAGSLSPRRERILSTTKGRYWVLLDQQGACVAIYQASHPENRIAIE